MNFTLKHLTIRFTVKENSFQNVLKKTARSGHIITLVRVISLLTWMAQANSEESQTEHAMDFSHFF